MGILSRKNKNKQIVEAAVVPPQPHVDDAELYEVLSSDRGIESVPSTVINIRKNGTPPPISSIVIRSVNATNWDGQTMVIRYNQPSMLHELRSLMSKYGRSNAVSYISPFIESDVYVNLNSDAQLMRGKNWLCVAYESIHGNPTPSAMKRYPNAMLVIVEKVTHNDRLDDGILTLDMLMREGRR